MRDALKKINHRAVVYLWRRRRDLNSRTGYPVYTLSRGASSAS
ncbi:unknown [Clostridium sp. CAG:448]|nr:unknown [Clostridium sp. CAG:448]